MAVIRVALGHPTPSPLPALSLFPRGGLPPLPFRSPGQPHRPFKEGRSPHAWEPGPLPKEGPPLPRGANTVPVLGSPCD